MTDTGETASSDEGGWGADAVLHVGKHGTLEWLPGKAVGVAADCYPDLFLGDLPLVYPFIINNPREGAQAKRRPHAAVMPNSTIDAATTKPRSHGTALLGNFAAAMVAVDVVKP